MYESMQYITDFSRNKEHDEVMHGRLWHRIFRHMTELHQPFPTRFGRDGTSMSFSRIDRHYTTLPTWAIAESTITTVTLDCPRRLADYGYSDHTPVAWTIQGPQQAGG